MKGIDSDSDSSEDGTSSDSNDNTDAEIIYDNLLLQLDAEDSAKDSSPLEERLDICTTERKNSTVLSRLSLAAHALQTSSDEDDDDNMDDDVTNDCANGTGKGSRSRSASLLSVEEAEQRAAPRINPKRRFSLHHQL